MSLVWISKPVFEEEAMSLSIFVLVSSHVCVVCRHFCCPVSLFQGHVACQKLTQTGPLTCSLLQQPWTAVFRLVTQRSSLLSLWGGALRDEPKGDYQPWGDSWRQISKASKKFYNKCLENSRSQIVFRTDIFRKLMLGAPEISTKPNFWKMLAPNIGSVSPRKPIKN